MEITKELSAIIEKTVEKVMERVHKSNIKAEEERNYFKETEILLYNYPALKLKVEQDEEFLMDPDATSARPVKSKDIVCFSGRAGHGLDIDRYTQGVKSSMMRTRQEVLRIDRALEAIKEDRYYDIIPMKYFDGMSYEEIAERFDKDERTCRRNKNRLINKIKVMLFGTEAL